MAKFESLSGSQQGCWFVKQKVAAPANQTSAWYWCICKHCNAEKAVSAQTLRTLPVGCRKCRWTGRLGTESRRWSGIGAIGRDYWTRVKKGAKARKLKLTVTHKYVAALFEKQGGRCALSGRSICALTRLGTASLDRIDSSKGYVPGNVQWVHKQINWMKGAIPECEFVALCREVVAHHEGTKKCESKS